MYLTTQPSLRLEGCISEMVPDETGLVGTCTFVKSGSYSRYMLPVF